MVAPRIGLQHPTLTCAPLPLFLPASLIWSCSATGAGHFLSVASHFGHRLLAHALLVPLALMFAPVANSRWGFLRGQFQWTRLLHFNTRRKSNAGGHDPNNSRTFLCCGVPSWIARYTWCLSGELWCSLPDCLHLINLQVQRPFHHSLWSDYHCHGCLQSVLHPARNDFIVVQTQVEIWGWSMGFCLHPLWLRLVFLWSFALLVHSLLIFLISSFLLAFAFVLRCFFF